MSGVAMLDAPAGTAKRRPTCHLGQHRPRPVRVRDVEDARTICIDCRCTLVRTRATRRWFVSGLLA